MRATQRRVIAAAAILIAACLMSGSAPAADASDPQAEVLASPEPGHIFEIHKGAGSKTIKALNAGAGQKLRLVGFGPLSLDRLRSQIKIDDRGALLDLGDQQQVSIPGAGADVVSSIQIQLDRSGLVASFADEFDSLNLDLKKGGRQPGAWQTNFGYGGLNSFTLANNGELEVYVDSQFTGTAETSLNLDPFRIVNGTLEIAAQPIKQDLRRFTWDRPYSSGLLTSKGAFAQQYGLFEIRAKIPSGKGLWPAFWLLPVNGAWPPEIDVLEILGDNPQKLYVSWHSNVSDKHTSNTTAINVPDTSEDFHTYSVYWTEDEVEWFFDDVEVASRSTPQDFHQPMYMLINLAVGGGWPGAPNSSTKFPAKYTIDWVRAYARKDAR